MLCMILNLLKIGKRNNNQLKIDEEEFGKENVDIIQDNHPASSFIDHCDNCGVEFNENEYIQYCPFCGSTVG